MFSVVHSDVLEGYQPSRRGPEIEVGSYVGGWYVTLRRGKLHSNSC